MKKKLTFIVFALMAAFSLALVSCSSDDDDNNDDIVNKEDGTSWSDSDFIGTWSLQYTEGLGTTNDDGFEYIQLKSDGTCIDVVDDEDEDDGYYVSNGKWDVSDNKLNIRIKSGVWSGTTFTYDIVKKEKNKLTVTMWGITAYLVRVNDDTISKYL